jgi:hypothetical protein
MVLKAAWHCGSDISAVNDPLGEPGRTPLYVGLPSTWGSMNRDHIFSLFFVGGGSLLGTQTDIMNELMNRGLRIGDSDKYSE